MPPPTSKAWNYFKRTTDSITVKCKLCETELTYTGGTTNMLNHLRLKHNTGIEHENTPQKQPSMAEFVRSPRSRHLSGTKAEEITRAVVNMVVQDYMPPPLGKSDHEVLTFNLRCSSMQRDKLQKRKKYFKGNYPEINKYLTTVDWTSVLSGGSVDDTWNSLADKIQIAVRENIPESKPSTRKFNTPWMDKETLDKVKKKRKLWKKYKYCRSPENKAKYDEAKETASNSVKAAKRSYEKQIALNMKNDSKIFWKFVQSKTKVKEDIQCIIDDSGEIHSENLKKAELLNTFFTSVFTDENEDNMPEFETRTDKILEEINIDVNTVEKLLSQVKETKSQGPDGIHPKFIKETSRELSKPVSMLFKKSVEEGRLPQAWKEANITPIHKKGPKHKVGNYRPISLTSILCKILERLIRNEIMDHMESNNLFTKHQHGFRKGHSCVTQLIEVIEDWTEALDQHNSIDTIYLDFQKAFDTVPHRRLLKKLQGYGITGSLFRWLESFLIGRKQKVVLNGEESDWTNVTSGIPQGSVLGPILFLIYINDLPDVVNSIVKLFADDTKIYANVNTIENQERLQEDINNLMEWSDSWQLKFNKSKCKHLHLGRNTDTTYKIEGENIEKITEEKDLGVTIDSQLKFQKHIGIQVQKANKILGLIRRSFSYLDEEMFTTLYKSLVRPHLEYGSNVWSVVFKKDAIQLENVQRRATRLLPHIRHLSYSDRLKHLGIPTLQYRRQRADIIEVYKIMNDIDIADKAKLFPISAVTTTRGHHQKIFKRHSRTNIRKHSFANRIVDLWNNLPAEVIRATSTNSFKSKINTFWKDLELKFQPDCYGPEARQRTNHQDESEGHRP